MIKLKKLIKETYAWERKFGEPLPTLADVQRKKLTEAAKHGFDLTDFKSGGFQKLLKLLQIKPKAKLEKSRHGVHQWEWKGKNILIVTGNNPITGQFAEPNRRKDEKNYASYIGIEGDQDAVETAVELIKQYGSSKGESKGRRGFI